VNAANHHHESNLQPVDRDLVVRLLNCAQEIKLCQALRHEVWSSGGSILHLGDQAMIADPLDETAFHWGAYVSGRLVASARLSIHDDLRGAPDGYLFAELPVPFPIASINRMVVHFEYRSRGIARAIDMLRIQKARECGCRTMIAAPVKEGGSIPRLRSYGFIFTGVDGVADWGKIPITAAYLPLDVAG